MTDIPTSTPSAPAASVSLEEVRHVAALANLELTPDEEPRMQHDLNAILAHVARLQQLDTTGVEAMAQVGQLLQIPAAPAGADLRPDAVRPSVDRSEVMREAPETDGRFFKVPKVIER
ncbi:Asp-tRNA(Asn)/Glu-tRNA(Gln) amidotransferase subunit GatC [Terriglobus aquaticus]|uniref:Aspartyl/glutamyl-tRNA(Asn/Gln) amidotransferase subunit C n=1 Tax=Terriglobus aquaticus TaxID=940139 RepID=A0ABW9KJR9_9BACT|nr:Asp-tRNA(Asn)/Glu-tRNA(Gln) amidotransferase subunit GatC [Terriglobus aquaticus]